MIPSGEKARQIVRCKILKLTIITNPPKITPKVKELLITKKLIEERNKRISQFRVLKSLYNVFQSIWFLKLKYLWSFYT